MVNPGHKDTEPPCSISGFIRPFVFVLISVETYYEAFCSDGFFELNYCWASQETEVTSTPTRPVENAVITKKGLQERNIQMLDGTTVENKGKIIN